MPSTTDTVAGAAPATLERLSRGIPPSLLIISPQAGALAAACRQNWPDCAITALTEPPAGGHSELGRYALILVHDALEKLPTEAGSQLLARLRDLHAAGPLLVTLHADSKGCRERDLLALGLHREGSPAAADERAGGHRLFSFSLRDYKLTPEWLNARFWANPEQWGKHRW